MKIEDIKDGDELWVFDRAKDKYVKRTIMVGPSGVPYFLSDPRGYFKTRDRVAVGPDHDIVTDAELPQAKKRNAERRKAEKAAEAARVERVARANAIAERLLAAGVGEIQYGGVLVKSRVGRDGLIRVDITPEQAEILIAAAERKPDGE